MRYKISEVSKILNIPIDTIRYYEKQGIIKPSIDDKSNYRYYDAWDINFLLDYKHYRSLEFSMENVLTIQQTDDLESFTKRMNDQQDHLTKKQQYYSSLVERNSSRIESINSISDHLFRCSIREMSSMEYFIHRYNYQYDTIDKSDGIFENWLQFYPFINNMVKIKHADIKTDINNYEWGFSIETKWADILKLKISDHVVHVPRSKVIYTVIRAGDKGTFSNNLLAHACEYADMNNLSIMGDAIGYLLARVHQPDGYARYIEFLLPVTTI